MSAGTTGDDFRAVCWAYREQATTWKDSSWSENQCCHCCADALTPHLQVSSDGSVRWPRGLGKPAGAPDHARPTRPEHPCSEGLPIAAQWSTHFQRYIEPFQRGNSVLFRYPRCTHLQGRFAINNARQKVPPLARPQLTLGTGLASRCGSELPWPLCSSSQKSGLSSLHPPG